jgi:hypothetical protein
MNIFCDRKLLFQFRRECRERFPSEHFAAIYGTRSPEGNVLITRIAPIEHTSNSGAIYIKNGAIQRSKRSALRAEADWLGTIHSHCDAPNDPACWHLSDSDIRSALSDGESISGIVFVDQGGTRTTVHWYVPQPLPIAIYS